MRIRAIAALASTFAVFAAAPASAALLITVDKAVQRMTVELDGQQIFDWPVSTGQVGYDTPSGDYKPFRKEKDHYSREWDDAPMPNSIFFTMQGHAIHGTSHAKALGTPASHGCVRLSVENSETLWRLVAQEKMANTRIVLLGETPGPAQQPPMANAPDMRPDTYRAPKRSQRAYAPPSYDNGQDFTGALPGVMDYQTREGQRVRGPAGAAYYDGRYFYDRNGRRMANAAPPPAPNYYQGRDYYGGPQPPQPRMYRQREGYFPGGNWN